MTENASLGLSKFKMAKYFHNIRLKAGTTEGRGVLSPIDLAQKCPF